jgi:putative endonuclease
MADGRWFVYLIECATGRIYVGITPNLEQRMTAHRKGRGALFTRINPPERLLGAKPYADRREAQQMEAQVKRLPAAYKRFLAAQWSEQHIIDERAQEALAVHEG